jgi:fructose-1,6-bisphosphatase/inositol monophosphatase family enzyme
MPDFHTIETLLEPLRMLHNRIRDEVIRSCEEAALEQNASVYLEEADGDTLYEIDRVSEAVLLDVITREIASHVPVVLIAEGLSGGQRILPDGAKEEDAVWRIIVDPIDGTRGLMYQKRPAWILTGVAPNKGPSTCLQDIQLAIQTEIPLIKQHLCDQLWGCRHKGLSALRYNRLSGSESPICLQPSRSTSLEHGFAMISRFFPGARDELAAIDEHLIQQLLGPVQPGKAHCFEDQYISSGGQLYELIAGHDRFVADLRPLMEQVLQKRGLSLGICCHPYDLCTALLAEEAGVLVCDLHGAPLSAPLDVLTDVGWVGYANPTLRETIEPVLMAILKERGLL